jgi:sulfur carrier protein
VNDQWHDVSAADLAALLRELGYCDAVLATALNGEFVPVSARLTTKLAEGDQLEILAPMQGG